MANHRVAEVNLAPPRPTGKTVNRARLQIDEHESPRRLTILRAPAGYGKTTLMQQWHDSLTAAGADVAWITVGSGDNVQASLARHIEQAIARSMRNWRMPQENCSDVLDMLEHISHKTSGRFTLLIDEIELLSSDESLQLIRAIVNITSDNFHLVLSGRTIPAVGQSRLFLDDAGREFDIEDLKFSVPEVGKLFALRLGKPLAPADLTRIENRLDGWPAGLQFACLAMRNQDDINQFLEDAPAHGTIADYLKEDVYTKLSGEIRDFLVATSPFNTLSAELCDAVTGRSDSAAILNQLHHSGFFLKRVEGTRGIAGYKFHDVFASFLRGQLAAKGKAFASTIHRTASAWYAEQEMWPEAIEQATQSGDRVTALRLLDQISMRYVSWGFIEELRNSSGKMSTDEIKQFPIAFLGWLWTEFFVGNNQAIESGIKQIRATYGNDDPMPLNIKNHVNSLEVNFLTLIDH